MAIFNSYVTLPEGSSKIAQLRHQSPFASGCEPRSHHAVARPDLRVAHAGPPERQPIAMPWTLGPANGHFEGAEKIYHPMIEELATEGMSHV